MNWCFHSSHSDDLDWGNAMSCYVYGHVVIPKNMSITSEYGVILAGAMLITCVCWYQFYSDAKVLD